MGHPMGLDFEVFTDHWVKIKENEKLEKYLDIAIELRKKLWNMKVTGIPIIIETLGTIPKNLKKIYNAKVMQR